MSINLLESYERFYADTTLDNAELLWKSIAEYDFEDYRNFCYSLKEIRKVVPKIRSNSELLLQSNGTTSQGSRRFSLGPHALFWLNKIERLVKFPNGMVKNLGLVLTFSPTTYEWRDIPTSVSCYKPVPVDHIFKSCMNQYDLVLLLTQKIREIGSLVISGQPNTFLYLNSHQDFEDFLLKSGKVLSIIPHDWEPFFKKQRLLSKGFHINDNCVNWTTGVNFYTCNFNVRHFLPTFIVDEKSIFNLLNLSCSADYPVDDLIKINEIRKKCLCGKWYLPFTFTPHINFSIRTPDGKLIYDDSIIEQLESKYYNLQFIQRGHDVDVLYIASTDMSKVDIEILRHFLTGLNVNFIGNSYAICGMGKIIPYWNGPISKYFKFKLKLM